MLLSAVSVLAAEHAAFQPASTRDAVGTYQDSSGGGDGILQWMGGRNCVTCSRILSNLFLIVLSLQPLQLNLILSVEGGKAAFVWL